MSKTILLDRDGVINKLLVDPKTGLTDSPMTIDQIEIFDWIPEVLKYFTDNNYNIVIITNQPAAAKNKISYKDLYNIHLEIIKKSKVKISDSFICWHKSQDNCDCRKPKTKLLEMAYNKYKFDKNNTWFVGDRATDIIAGYNFGLKTALLGPSLKEDIDMLLNKNIKYSYLGKNLKEFKDDIFA